MHTKLLILVLIMMRTFCFKFSSSYVRIRGANRENHVEYEHISVVTFVRFLRSILCSSIYYYYCHHNYYDRAGIVESV
jgi:hypothetical protein